MRGDDAELFEPDGRHHRSFVSFCRVRNGSRHRADPRLCTAAIVDHWQLLGRSQPWHSLRPAPNLRAGGTLPHHAGRAANPGPFDRERDP